MDSLTIDLHIIYYLSTAIKVCASPVAGGGEGSCICRARLWGQAATLGLSLVRSEFRAAARTLRVSHGRRIRAGAGCWREELKSGREGEFALGKMSCSPF